MQSSIRWIIEILFFINFLIIILYLRKIVIMLNVIKSDIQIQQNDFINQKEKESDLHGILNNRLLSIQNQRFSK